MSEIVLNLDLDDVNQVRSCRSWLTDEIVQRVERVTGVSPDRELVIVALGELLTNACQRRQLCPMLTIRIDGCAVSITNQQITAASAEIAANLGHSFPNANDLPDHGQGFAMISAIVGAGGFRLNHDEGGVWEVLDFGRSGAASPEIGRLAG